MSSTNFHHFLDWFQSQGGYIDTTSINVIEFPPAEGGRGAVATRHIPSGHTLFTIPRSATLSTRTCKLPSLFGIESWKALKLHEGWAGLILCMMWEAARPTDSKWSKYLESLPTSFTTPMFWNESDLAELEGTSVVEKLGKDDAERDFREKVIPALNARPDLFVKNEPQDYYSLDIYHTMGSRILSRSFNVEKWDGGEFTEDDNTRNAMDVDSNEVPREQTDNLTHEDDTEEDDSLDIAMVPMADLLNARYRCENAKLFHEQHDLKMIATKNIMAREQIWNTYGDLPNAELLRRYGHVDLLPLPDNTLGNPGDVVEIRADLIVAAVTKYLPEITNEVTQERIDWWLEEGGDDIFIIEYDFEVPQDLVSFARLLSNNTEWDIARRRGKPPKPKFDSDVVSILLEILEKRLGQYPTSIEDDYQMLKQEIPGNKNNAIIVRVGEKKILKGTLEKLHALVGKNDANAEKTKRRLDNDSVDTETTTNAKKSKQ